MTGRKLPLMPTGASVALARLPLTAGAVAHRPGTRSTTNQRRGRPVRTTVYVVACAPRGPEAAALLSATWADHQGAIACTAAACFPNA